MDDALRWGILGAGHIAGRFAQDLGHSAKGRLVAVASRSLDKAQGFVSDLPNVEAVAGYGALLSREDIDAVYIATPAALHTEHCLHALAAEKHVLCEKPFATSARDAERVLAQAKAKGLFCMEALWSQFLPVFKDLRRQRDQRSLGTLTHLNITLGFARKFVAGDPVCDPALGGGALFDLGIYGVAFALDLCGPASLVGSSLQRDAHGAVRTASLLLQHDTEGGCISTSITCSHTTTLANTLTLAGTKRVITVDAPFIGATSCRTKSVVPLDPSAPVSAKSRLLGSPVWPILRRAKQLIQHPAGKKSSFPYPGTGLHFQADEVVDCIRARATGSTTMPLERTVAAISIMQQAQDQ